MATILLSAAGAAIGSGFGGTALGLSGSVIGRAIGGAVGRSIDQRIIGAGSDPVETGRIDRFRISAVGYGVPMREVWGRMRVAGEVIWASRFNESMQSMRQTGGGKGSPKPVTQTFSYSVSLAISLCMGEASSVGRVWADGVEIAKNSLNIRFYPGNEDQLPDSKIEAVEGVGFAPSYRGTCYVVIEELQLSRFGNRVPQFSFEVIREAKGFAAATPSNIPQSVRAVALIPGSGDYSLATSPVHFNIAPGKNKTANVHSVQDMSDFQLSLNQMTDELPNCEAVSLVVSWFGSDLRCGHCRVKPKVEQNLNDSRAMPWKVSGVLRSGASVVPSAGGRPIYGGTPSDQSVVAAIKAIRASGKSVMFYPFILMDQLQDNGLPDPWSEANSQPELPWRGRITLSRAPGLPGSSDRTSAAEVELNAFLGSANPNDFTQSEDTVHFANPAEWGYRRFILHYAHLCVLAGGVDSFCIGSELRSLTQIRAQANAFPMVVALRQLAAEVKSILGFGTKVSYAADWSEYFGYHVDGDVFFHLDPLWADPSIDFVGIDNYMPISDWRDNKDHKDKEWNSIYNIEYLLANIAGGEGFDWYYEGSDAENQQIRRPISDGAFGEDWVFRYKDMKGWWSNQHHDRVGGDRNSIPSPWLPGMKPIRFTEYGCAAVDKATNQPNKFLDSKSSESCLPRASNGERDDYIQLQYLRAMAIFWNDEVNNPQAAQYAGRMIDFGNSFVWAWDARPYPDFPGNSNVWSDTGNYARGHWLNGRSSNQQLSDVVADLCRDELTQDCVDVSELYGVLRGYHADSSDSPRSKLQTLSFVFGFDIVEVEGTLAFSHRDGVAVREIDERNLVVSSDARWLNKVLSGSASTPPSCVRLNYIEADNDFEVRSIEAAYSQGASSVATDSECSILLSEVEAQTVVDRWLAEARKSKDSCQFSLPRSYLSLSNGDVVSIFDSDYRIDSIEFAEAIRFDATRVNAGAYLKGASLSSRPLRISPVPASPIYATFLDLPLVTGSEIPTSPYLAAVVDPWPGPVALWDSATDSGFNLNTTLSAPATLGVLMAPLTKSWSGLWDRSSKVSVSLSSGILLSVLPSDVLNGSNLAAIGDGSPENWEIVQFVSADLVAPDTYEISMLLRGQFGTNATCPAIWPAGSLFVVLDSSVKQIDLAMSARGLERFYRIGQLEKGYTDSNVSSHVATFNGIGLRPYSVAHLRALRGADASVLVSWVRRTRFDGDSWQSSEVPLGEELESYTLRVLANGVIVREVILSTQSWTYTPSMQFADLIGSSFLLSVAQNSRSFGSGPFVSVGVGG